MREPRGPRLCRVPPAPGPGPAHTCLCGSHTGVRGSHTGVRGSPTGVCGSHIRAGSEVGPGRFRSTLGAGDAGPHFQCHFGHERAKNSTPRDVNHGKFITVSSPIVLDTSRRLGRTFFFDLFFQGGMSKIPAPGSRSGRDGNFVKFTPGALLYAAPYHARALPIIIAIPRRRPLGAPGGPRGGPGGPRGAQGAPWGPRGAQGAPEP